MRKYHDWMEDGWLRGECRPRGVAHHRPPPFVLLPAATAPSPRALGPAAARADMTASERMTLPEEYAMQAAWVDDDQSA